MTDMIGFGWACVDDLAGHLIMTGLAVQSSSLLFMVVISLHHWVLALQLLFRMPQIYPCIGLVRLTA